MKTKKNNFSLILGIVILFIFAFIILISKQSERKLGDVYSTLFNVTPIINERMVIKDYSSSFSKYYVIYFDNTDDTYIIHGFNYYENKDQFDWEFNRLNNSIVDYDYNNFSIRYVASKGRGDYNYVYNNINIILDNNNLFVYE